MRVLRILRRDTDTPRGNLRARIRKIDFGARGKREMIDGRRDAPPSGFSTRG